MFEKAILVSHAVKLADFFSILPGVERVLLTGSLARQEETAGANGANDIDLVVLHDGSLTDMGFSIAKGRHRNCDYMYQRDTLYEGLDGLKMLGNGKIPAAIQRYLQEEVHCLVDIICADARVLQDCFYLGRFASLDKDPDFSKRIFCELPLLEFDPRTGAFLIRRIHRDGVCCKPRIAWQEVKEKRVKV